MTVGEFLEMVKGMDKSTTMEMFNEGNEWYGRRGMNKEEWAKIGGRFVLSFGGAWRLIDVDNFKYLVKSQAKRAKKELSTIKKKYEIVDGVYLPKNRKEIAIGKEGLPIGFKFSYSEEEIEQLEKEARDE